MAPRADTTEAGMDVCGALGVAFVVLKLCGVLGWSWWWVLAPFWGPPVAVIAVLATAFAAGGAFAKDSMSGTTGTGSRARDRPEGQAPGLIHRRW